MGDECSRAKKTAGHQLHGAVAFIASRSSVPLRRAFRDLRDLPPAQRQQMLNSSQSQGESSPQERGILSNLLTVEPYQVEQACSGKPSQEPQSNVPIPLIANFRRRLSSQEVFRQKDDICRAFCKPPHEVGIPLRPKGMYTRILNPSRTRDFCNRGVRRRASGIRSVLESKLRRGRSGGWPG